jgi:hypothetical protein
MFAGIVNQPDSAEFSCQGMSVMGNASPSPKDTITASQLHRDEDYADDLDSDVVALLEENARLRALVTQLSDLVLRHVVQK